MNKILILINSLGCGGTEYVVSELSIWLSKSMECQVITTTDFYEPMFPTNTPPIHLHTSKTKYPRIIKVPYCGLRLLIKYIYLVKQYSPDIVLSTHPWNTGRLFMDGYYGFYS